MTKKILLGLLLAIGLALAPTSYATVSNTNVQTITANGNGATTNYAIGFDFRDNSWVTVTLVDAATSPATRTTIAQGAGAGKFTITGGNPGTTVVMGTAPSVTQHLEINRSIPLTQPVVFDPASIFPYKGLSDQIDKAMLEIQNLNAGLGNGAGGGGGGGGTTIPTGVGYNFLCWDSLGTTLGNCGGTPANGDVLRFNGSSWANYSFTGSGLAGLINSAGAVINPGSGGTGVANNGLLTWGTHALTFNLGADTTLTLPTSGTLLAGTADTANTANTFVKRDGSGNFSAGTVTANVVGNVTGNVVGNVTGNVTGTSASVTGVTPIGHGGTGQTTRQAAIDALAGTLTDGFFPRADGTHVNMEPLRIDDVPQGFSRLKLHQGTPNTVVLNDGSGNLFDLAGNHAGDLLTFNGLTWVSLPPGASPPLSMVTTFTADYSANALDLIMVANCTVAACTLTLPLISVIEQTIGGLEYSYPMNIKNVGNKALTVATSGADVIDGAATAAMPYQYQAITVIPTSSGWVVQ